MNALHKQMFYLMTDFNSMTQFAQVQKAKLNTANDQLLKYAYDFATTVSDLKKANQDLQAAYLDTIHRLVKASEYKDKDTGDHIIRIGKSSAYLAEKLGLPADEVDTLLYAAPMHDVGKIGIADSILLKPGQLTDEEFKIMQSHTLIGGNILSYSKSKILCMARDIALYHHEQWNGAGYPERKQGDAIPLAARIVGLVDTFDALTADRPYKKAYPADVAIDIIRAGKNRRFDPRLVDLFMDLGKEIVENCFPNVRPTLENGVTLVMSERDTGAKFPCPDAYPPNAGRFASAVAG